MSYTCIVIENKIGATLPRYQFELQQVYSGKYFFIIIKSEKTKKHNKNSDCKN